MINATLDKAREENLLSSIFTFTIYSARPAGKAANGLLISPVYRNRMLQQMGVSYLLCPPFEEFRGMEPEAYVHDVLMGLLRAKYIFCGENFHFGKNASGTVELLRRLGEAAGIEVRTLPLVFREGAPVNSTRIRGHVVEGDVQAAHRLLGRPFAIDFVVIGGNRLGRTLDAPTINQALPEWFVKPRFGVYATRTTVEGKVYASVSNVGVKPTLGSDQVLAETYILGYEGDLYGHNVLVEFLDFIRPEVKFDSIDALREQIHRDARQAEALFDRHCASGSYSQRT